MLLDRVRRTIRRHHLATPETRVLAAVSGGPDSVALVHLLRELHERGELQLAGLAHLNHQLRDAASLDEQFCLELAAGAGVPIEIDREDVAARAARERRSLEDAARAARYEFLERARVRRGAAVVALGHTRDDQAETYLLRLLRGAGVRGLAAMHPQAGVMIRPLLDCRRADLREFLGARGIPFVIDESNADVAIPRNRVRAELLPLLERRFNPAIVEVLADQAAAARDEWLWLEAAAEQLRAESWDAEGATLDATALAAAPRALCRYVLWRAMTRAAGGRPLGFEHVEAAMALLEPGGEGHGIDAPGHRVERVGATVVLRSRPAGATGRSAPVRTNLFSYSLSIPGEVLVPEAGRLVSAELENGSRPAEPGVAVRVRQDAVGCRLAIRNRRAGDRFRPAGLDGHKRLQDFFVDRKVPRAERDQVPIVVDEQDRIVWVGGYALDEAFRVTDPAQGVIILRLKVLGGRA